MPLMPHSQQRAQYIIRCDEPRELTRLIDRVKQDPDIELVDTIGPRAAPHTIVATMTNEKAIAFEQEFSQGKSATIEHDRPLSLYEKGTGA